MHPEVFEWAVNELSRYSNHDTLLDNKPYLTRHGGRRWCIKYGSSVSDYMKGRRNNVEYGILHPERYPAELAANGMAVNTNCEELGQRIEEELDDLCTKHSKLLRRWREEGNDHETWSAKISGAGAAGAAGAGDSRAEVEKSLTDWISSYDITMPTIKWLTNWPVSPAVYDPKDKTLYLHTWLLEKARKQDMVVLVLHEVLGHHYQENNVTSSSAQAESCAMSCESLASELTGSRVPEIEWRCMRLCRALLDLRMHFQFNHEKYNTPESVWRVWNAKLGGAFDAIVPLPSETLRVAALPGQALGYVVPDVCPEEGCAGCHAACTEANPTRSAGQSHRTNVLQPSRRRHKHVSCARLRACHTPR